MRKQRPPGEGHIEQGEEPRFESPESGFRVYTCNFHIENLFPPPATLLPQLESSKRTLSPVPPHHPALFSQSMFLGVKNPNCYWWE